jgi:hypothetical protein
MFHLLKPKTINEKKVRVGPYSERDNEHSDGGYVCSQMMIDKCSCLFTFGVGGETRYEFDFAKRFKKPVYMFDPFVDRPAKEDPEIYFYKVGLGLAGTNVNNIPAKEVVQLYKELGIKGDVLLKIDTEGSEYDYFAKTDIAEIAKYCTGIILEIHWLDGPEWRQKAEVIINRLNEYFVLTHVHGNNWGEVFKYEQKIHDSKSVIYTIPRVWEVTFENKRFVNYIAPDTQNYPIEKLDCRNRANPGDKDLDLSFLHDFKEPQQST